jgi:hypothetical protein
MPIKNITSDVPTLVIITTVVLCGVTAFVLVGTWTLPFASVLMPRTRMCGVVPPIAIGLQGTVLN